MTKQLTQLEVKALIDKHDPALLFDLGAPEDEYVGEAKTQSNASNITTKNAAHNLRKGTLHSK